MSRHADHDARREQMSQAAIDIALGEGLARVTVARVAATARVSVGLVQHYFSSKHALMTRVYEDLLAHADERVAAIVERGEAEQRSIRDMTIDALSQLLPLDDPRRAECLARAELETMAARDSALRRVATHHGRRLQSRLATVVQNAKKCGEAPTHLDARFGADLLWSAVTGTAKLELLQSSLDSEAVLRDTALRVFPLECHRHR